MTNHIEELMKAAGVVPVHLTDCIFINIRKGYDVGTDCCPGVEDERLKCEDCEHSKETQLTYPAFTPAKQLELIKLILKGSKTYNLELEYVGVCDHYCFSWFDATVPYDDCITVKNKYYELALAELVYTLINENKLDKSEVKRILEDDN